LPRDEAVAPNDNSNQFVWCVSLNLAAADAVSTFRRQRRARGVSCLRQVNHGFIGFGDFTDTFRLDDPAAGADEGDSGDPMTTQRGQDLIVLIT
jgi:hypothetical protein